MEFLIGFGLYLLVMSVMVFPLTSMSYKAYLKQPVSWNEEKYSEEEILNLEKNRRAILRSKAKKMGFWVAFFWIIAIPAEIFMQIVSGLNGNVNKTLAAHDDDIENRLAQIKAQRILDKHEADKKAEFDKQLAE